MIKYLVLMFGMLGLVFSACDIMTVSEFANNSINLSSNCLTIIDENTTSNFTIIYESPPPTPPPTYNQTIYVNPEQSQTHLATNITCVGIGVKTNNTYTMYPPMAITDPVSNNIYNCNSTPSTSLEWVNTTIQNGGTYTSDTRNISVHCEAVPPISCLQNISHESDYGEIFTNTECNINVSCPSYPVMNRDVGLNYGEVYTNDTLDFTCTCQNKTILDFKTELSSGSYYNNTDLQLSVYCRETSCKQNITKALEHGETFRSDICNIETSCTNASYAQSTAVIQAEWGVDKTDPDTGTVCRGPAKFSNPITLDGGQQYVHEESGLAVVCNSIQNVSNITQCSSVDINWESLSIINSQNENCTRREVCLDVFSQLCTKEEAFNGDIYGCVQRVVNESNNALNNCQLTIAQRDEEIARWKEPAILMGDNNETTLQLVMIFLAVVMGLVSLILYILLHHKKARVGSEAIGRVAKPTTVINGISAFRRACRTMTVFFLRPFE